MIRRIGLWSYLLIFLAGAAGALAMPPFDQWWVLGISFSGFAWLEARRPLPSMRRAFLSGWLLGFGYFLGVLQWLGNAFLVDAANDLWMMPFAVGGSAAFLACFWGLAQVLSSRMQRWGIEEFWSLPLCYGLAEFARGHVLSGFPWAVPGLAVDGMGGVAQGASLIGMNGLSFFILLWAMVPLVFLDRQKKLYVMGALALALLPLLWIWGDWREANYMRREVPGVVVRLVQPNIPQSDKWREGNAPKIWNTLLDLTEEPPTGGELPTHVIWPESAVPFLLDESSEAKDALRVALGGSKILLTGAVRRQSGADPAHPDYFTSVEIYDSGANLIGLYDKWHLVPGGEFLPMAWLFEPLGLRFLVNLPESFSAGSGPKSLALPGAGIVAPNICYEAIFSEAFANLAPRPDWFVNVTNDGWFGSSSGPYQHLAQLRLRAIEQGVSIARSANTGISAMIDPMGGYMFRSRINVAGAYDAHLPERIPATLFSLWGQLLQFMGPIVMLFMALLRREKNH